jgi:hypothetical protein
MEIKKAFPKIEELSEVIGTWEVWIEGCPVNPIKIKVLREANGMYTGIANYSIQNPKQATPYRSINPTESMRDSLISAISGFLMFYNRALVDETRFIKDEDF